MSYLYRGEINRISPECYFWDPLRHHWGRFTSIVRSHISHVTGPASASTGGYVPIPLILTGVNGDGIDINVSVEDHPDPYDYFSSM